MGVHFWNVVKGRERADDDARAGGRRRRERKREHSRSQPQQRTEIVSSISNIDDSRVVVSSYLLLGEEGLELFSCGIKNDASKKNQTKDQLCLVRRAFPPPLVQLESPLRQGEQRKRRTLAHVRRASNFATVLFGRVGSDSSSDDELSVLVPMGVVGGDSGEEIGEVVVLQERRRRGRERRMSLGSKAK